MHMSMNKEVVESQTLARTDETKWYPPFAIRQHTRDNTTFFSITAHTAFSLTKDIIKNVVGDHDLIPGGVMIFSLGVMDLYSHLPARKNTELVVKKYMDICYEFCKDAGLECRFQSPLYNLDSIEYDVFMETLNSYSLELGLYPPILTNGTVFPKKHPRSDKWSHFDWDEYDSIYNYILATLCKDYSTDEECSHEYCLKFNRISKDQQSVKGNLLL